MSDVTTRQLELKKKKEAEAVREWGQTGETVDVYVPLNLQRRAVRLTSGRKTKKINKQGCKSKCWLLNCTIDTL